MPRLRIHLFGRFSVHDGSQVVRGLEAGKDQELLSYLLIHRDRCHPRETLASLLWADTSTTRSKKYLRQALWHLQTALGDRELGRSRFLIVGHDWVQITLESELWLDVELFESACTFTHGASGKELDESNAELLKNAVQLYRGDLLEGWYQDWCLLERQRLQNLYLVLLDKLLAYSVKHNAFEAGFDYGSTILRYDRARESTHQQLMLLQYKAGNRTGALRQYERCVEALDEEFGVTPQRSTIALYEQMRADRLKEAAIAPLQLTSPIVPSAPEVLVRLKDLCLALGAVQDDLQNDIEALERALGTVRR